MWRSRALGVGTGFNNPPDPLSPEALDLCSRPPQAPIPCVHTQADSQQEERQPRALEHGAAALYSDGWDNSSPAQGREM